ncbi:conserved domain protein [Fibrobacter succinogenes subsp. succinogenes S85]|uniref:Conserved domain protein n=1 Tax=Fibrobacter succinogenes (strain ATCC 19169 / S85) TaxID=59374 RepID=D9S927_FIBSS|nr:hypothetical protein [Fibrobacter succinogenes]ADL26785.1 conserved domain protein [Fibrobacter succinogenes subsp. succinogenes S85]
MPNFSTPQEQGAVCFAGARGKPSHPYVIPASEPGFPFADKWEETPRKRANFYKWLVALKNDLQTLLALEGQDRVYKFISDKFGERVTKALFENMGASMKKEFDSGKVRISKAGTIGSVGVLASHGHTFYGS